MWRVCPSIVRVKLDSEKIHSGCRSTPGAPFHSDRLLGPSWVLKGVHWGVWVISDLTRTGAEGGSYIGSGTVTHYKKLISCGFLCHTLLNRYRPDYGTLTTMCFRPRYRWDENTPLNKRPHIFISHKAGGAGNGEGAGAWRSFFMPRIFSRRASVAVCVCGARATEDR